jgi:tRNA threonylcarbamoyladenosine modification (KEOPS) complex  Pcc1 subunit
VTRAEAAWSAVLTVDLAGAAAAGWLERSLAPEASREVPRATARLHRATERRLELRIEARDAGAMRAALNTYLGWIGLASETGRLAARAAAPPGAPP